MGKNKNPSPHVAILRLRAIALRLCMSALFLLIAPLSSHAKSPHQLPELTILAEPSMTEVFTKLARLYAKQHDVSVTAIFHNYANSIEYLEEGGEGNIVITAHPRVMQELQQRGLVDVTSIQKIAGNSLVLAVNRSYPMLKKSSTASNRLLAEVILQLSRNIALVMADPETSELGWYTRNILERLGIYLAVDPYAIRHFSSRSVLYMITNGNKAGIVFASDARNHPDIRVLAAIPPKLHAPVIYEGAILGGEKMEQAQKFLDFLGSRAATDILRAAGFTPLKQL